MIDSHSISLNLTFEENSENDSSENVTFLEYIKQSNE